ncbi:MAG: ribosome maturation factor RimP [Desulfobacteraceae bacterium]
MTENRSEKKNPVLDRIEKVAAPLCNAENIELVHLEILGQARDTTIRISIDKPGGVTLDDCADISRQLGDLFDVYLLEMNDYRLEVSSPGPRRPLKKEADFERFKGRKVRIETFEKINGQKRFTGFLKGFKNGHVELAADKDNRSFLLEQISKARLA